MNNDALDKESRDKRDVALDVAVKALTEIRDRNFHAGVPLETRDTKRAAKALERITELRK